LSIDFQDFPIVADSQHFAHCCRFLGGGGAGGVVVKQKHEHGIGNKLFFPS
jgi:hypothetical protein